MGPSPANIGEEEYNSKFRGRAASEAMERTSSPRKRVLTSDVTQIDFSYNYNIFKQAEELFREGRHRLRRGTKSYGWFGWAAVFLPCLHWLRRYRVREWLLPDILAGLSVGAMVVPQGMSYANLAGVPNVYGLYGAFVPTLVYALLGSSRQLAVGPVAVTSILLGNSIPGIMSDLGLPVNSNPNAPENPEAQAVYDRVVIQVAFLAGCIYTLVGLLRLGWITSFLSHAVVSGFMTGASIQIALSQVKYICGVSMSRQNPVQDQLRSLVNALSGFSWREFAMGMAFMALLLALKAAGQRFPRLVLLRALGPLCVCALSIAVMNIFGLWDSPSAAQPYIKPIGAVPKGLPQVTVGWWFPLYLPGRQVVLAVLVALIDLCESISIAKALAQRNGYVLNSTQELRGLGIANLAGAAFNCYTTTGSFSRSAVNNAVGARTPLASAVTGVVVCFVLLFLTPVFAHMSQNAMGAIVIVGVLQLFDIQEAIFLFRVNFFDFLVWLVACAVVLFVGVEWGIAASVALSLLIFIFRSAFPAVQRLAPIPGTPFFRPLAGGRAAQPRQPPAPPSGYLVVSIAAPIYFANVDAVREGLEKEVRRERRRIDRWNADRVAAARAEVESDGEEALEDGSRRSSSEEDCREAPSNDLSSTDALAKKDRTLPLALSDASPALQSSSVEEFTSSEPGSAGERHAARRLTHRRVAQLTGTEAPPGELEERVPPLRLYYVILDLSQSPTVDATAVHFVDVLLSSLAAKQTTLVLANPSRQVVGTLKAARLIPKIGPANMQVDVAEAVALVQSAIQELWTSQVL